MCFNWNYELAEKPHPSLEVQVKRHPDIGGYLLLLVLLLCLSAS